MTSPPPSSPADVRQEFWGDGARRRRLGGALAEATAVVITALRLLGRHWPVLLVIFLTGTVGHELAMRAAVRASLLNAELGMLVLLLAPMATLAALVLMLRVVRPSLPWLGGAGRPTPVLHHLGSVLLPFLTIYYFEDYLYDDIDGYTLRIVEHDTERIFVNLAESLDTGADAPQISSLDRLPYDLSLTLVAVVLAAIGARWLLSRWSATERHPWLGIPGAYLELVWLTLVVVAFVQTSDLILEWGGDRQLVHWVQAVWEQAVGTASGVAPASEGATNWFVGQLRQVDAVLVIPLSWLAIGAIILGHQPPPLTGSSARAGRGRQLYQGAARRWTAAPRGLRWAGAQVTADLRERFTPLLHGTGLLLRAGAVPMLLFCLAFVAARTFADWLWELQRLLVGPQDFVGVWIPLSWPLGELNEAVGHAVMVCLLAAAVDKALHASQPPPEPAAAPEAAAAPERAAGSTSNRT